MYVNKNATKVKGTYTQMNQRNVNISAKKELISIYQFNHVNQYATISISTTLHQRNAKETVAPRKFTTKKMTPVLSVISTNI